ncbi:helix-turn-helix transcriptional regulator [Lentzea sp. BCCO 10_0798]|uniref:Helix-turn-helix transcriptional regulator n=1 Tax=Lentzea kristufekii TaxID=3095430 RepID=A0ABU4U5B1_9PSEU|nr:helix-turn-helix transcriptional regulator [Lentzea sp. BCCO 10_0798]MDX8055747.1 helix-turn-helix transcriptional regulator [Lentzea sp. BCCO 10_0798]
MDVVGEWTGGLVRALRMALRMTMDELADKLDMSTRVVGKWEANPGLVPALATQQLLDVVLERATEGQRARFALLATQAGSGVSAVAADGVSGEDAQSVLVVPTTSAPLPRHEIGLPTSDTIAYLRSNLHNQYLADNLIGPRALLPVITAHVSTVNSLRRQVTGKAMDELLAIEAGYAEFAGWLSHDSGDLYSATRWYNHAYEMADAAGDERMCAFVLTRRAVQSIGEGDAHYGAKLARMAQRDKSVRTARVRALAAQTEAIGHAISGNHGETDRALDSAVLLTDLGNSILPDGDPSVGRYCEPGLYLKITNAKCQLELGRAESAVSAFRDVLRSLPSNYHRDRGNYLARLAQACALAGEPVDACIAIEESLGIALATGSTRTFADLEKIIPVQLAPWAKEPEVVRVREMLLDAQKSDGR